VRRADGAVDDAGADDVDDLQHQGGDPMKKILVALLLLGAIPAHAAQPSCKDQLPHVLTFGVPRTSLPDDSRQRLPMTLADLVGPLYVDPCGAGKSLQIHLAFGSDYEILDWMGRGQIDGGIVPNLSLWLLNYDENPLLELNPEASQDVLILRPLKPEPACMQLGPRGWRPCAANAEAEYAALLADIAAGNDVGARRVMFASHLSSTGFLDPIERAFEVFSQSGRDEAAQDAMWEKLFSVAHFAIDSDPARNPFLLAAQEEPQPRGVTVIAFPGEEVLARDDAPAVDEQGSYREHLLISSNVRTLFREGAVVTPEHPTPIVSSEFEKRLRREPLPPSLARIVHGDPASGVRGYAFTIEESLRLLAQQQRSSDQSELALVLPGGGVKAAYQSKIVDHLYGGHHLRNGDVGERNGSLMVRSVLGTSGGALLGYFVSQLGENGPFTLSDILWKPRGATLQYTDVFAATDMLRYISVAWTLMIFCIVLALLTGRYASPFYGRSVTPHGAWRWRLMTLLAVFFAVPILIRFVTGGDDIEHVPVIEGVFYSILTVLVMFCDQCFVYAKDGDSENRFLGLHVLLLAGIGGLFVFASSFGAVADVLQEPVGIGFAFATLSVIFLGSPLLLLYAGGRFGDVQRRLGDVLSSLVVVLIFCAFGIPGRLPKWVPHLVALLALIGLAVFAYWHAQREKRNPWVTWLLTFLTLLSTAVLCWPDGDKAESLSWSPNLNFLAADAFEKTRLAPFLASVGCLLLVMAAMVWVYRRREYTLDKGEDFSIALFLLVVHVGLTCLIVVTITFVPGLRVHSLELSTSFWMALTIVGGVLAAIIILAAPRRPMMKRAVEFLTSEHPNGSLVPRRYARILAVATLSVLWWNGMVAPALYGNDAARKYLDGAVSRFDRAFRVSTGEKKDLDKARGFIPTAKFVAPTNTLDEHDATRYFLFLTTKDPEFYLPRRIAGAEWRVFRTVPHRMSFHDCRKTIDPGCASFVQDVIFSSGSPFPILAAHRVNIPGEGKLGLIDGGYSNDIPIDAAKTIAARQVLVIHSTPQVSEAPHESSEESSLSFTPGMLIRNAKRLPSFMFERGQQVDRLSRQNLFVIGLAPTSDPGKTWPSLAQFDSATVTYMQQRAETNLRDRIGFAESWGEPRFRFSQQISEQGTTPDARRSTKADRRSQPPAPPAAH
jgi:predicted acylesterase/phospholipase RssA